jgi:dethiobiotin synthetase
MTLLPRGIFVTGTDTGVGKTLVACALLHALRARGVRALGMKPVAAGARRVHGRLVNDDVEALKRASALEASEELVNPYCFEPAIAPHIAAEMAGCDVALERLASAYRELAASAECVVVEGAGGFRVPLGRDWDFADFARLLGLPVVLVVGLRLGCLNHAILTAAAISHAGLRLAAWAANDIDAHMLYAQENVRTLKARLRAPLIAHVPYQTQPDARNIAHLVDLDALT